jgi:predicted metal-binding membrane protein
MRIDRGIEAVLRWERIVVALSLVVLSALAWMHLLNGAGTGMSVRAMSTWVFPPPVPENSFAARWEGSYALTMLAMWWVMMIAMMLPSASPMVLLYARTRSRAEARGQSTSRLGSTSLFTLGYLTVWLLFSVVATALQWMLEATGMLHGMLMWSTSPALTAGLLATAGFYQLSTWKAACLEHCRSPVDWLASNWRPGEAGAFTMGLVHGAYCAGCCWGLMLLLFAGGTMNLAWIAGLALIVLAEKLLPWGRLIRYGVGLLLLASSTALIIFPWYP